MNTYKTITYKSKNGDVNCYVIDGQTFLSIKDISILFNKSRTSILNYLKKLKNNLRCQKIDIVTDVQKKAIYSLDTVYEIAKLLGDFSIIDFQNWISNLSIFAEDEQYKIVRYNQDNIEIDVRLSIKEETVWMSQNQIAELYGTTQPNISMHIKKIINESELDFDSVHKDFLYTATDNKTYFIDCFNLDMILAIGYRVKSKRAIGFRKWVSSVIKSYVSGRLFVKRDSESVGWSEFVSLAYKVDKIEDRLLVLEKSNSEKPLLITDGMYFDAFKYLKDIIVKAEQSIIIIDSYADDNLLSLLSYIKPNINIYVITSHKSKLTDIAVSSFEKQYGKVNIVKTNKIHDRFIIIDNQTIYRLGTSINYMGNKLTILDKVEDEMINEVLLNYLKTIL